jgi:ribosomal protein L7/L12
MADLSDEQLETIQSELRAGRKIGAVKYYREFTGTILAEAKHAVEMIERKGAVAAGLSGTLSDDGIEPILVELRAGRKIQAIKMYREATGLGLAEAKAAVEQLAIANAIPEPAKKAGCGASAIVFLTVSAATYALIHSLVTR